LQKEYAPQVHFCNESIHRSYHFLTFHTDSLYLSKWKKIRDKYLSMLDTLLLLFIKSLTIDNNPNEATLDSRYESKN
jgi:hypothetical protein